MPVCLEAKINGQLLISHITRDSYWNNTSNTALNETRTKLGNIFR